MRRLTASLATALIVLACGAAQAGNDEPFSASEVASWCQSFRTAVINNGTARISNSPESQRCYGAFLTIQQLATMGWGDRPNESLLRVCLPKEGRLTDHVKVYLKYVDDHPELGHKEFAEVVLSSFQHAYPCPSNTPVK